MGLPASTDIVMDPSGPPASGRRLSNDGQKGFTALRSGQNRGSNTRGFARLRWQRSCEEQWWKVGGLRDIEAWAVSSETRVVERKSTSHIE